jgi:hypothetical protein
MNNSTVKMRWKDEPKIYPPVEEVIAALQDVGKAVKVTQKGKDTMKTRFVLMEKLALKVYTQIKKVFNPEGLTKNATRGKQRLFKEILLSRKHVDVTELDVFFHPYAKDGKVYTISNSRVHCRLDLAIEAFQKDLEAFLAQKNTARTANDGLRLACIMLDATYRGSVSGILTKKKDQRKADVPGDPTTSFFEQIVTEAFMNQDYFISPPPDVYYDQFPEDEKGNWDPNDPGIFENERDGKWLRSTWDDYVKPK